MALAVLQSDKTTDGKDSSGSKLVLPYDKLSPADSAAAKPDAVLKVKIEITRKHDPNASDNKKPAVEPAEDSDIFMSSNPHAVKFEGTSPFVKQVGQAAPSYQRKRISGKAKAVTQPTATLTIAGDADSSKKTANSSGASTS